MKYIIWLVIAVAVVVWLQRLKKALTGGSASSPLRRQPRRLPESMVQCAHCGMHFPASEALTNAAGEVFCSDEHRRLAAD